jgi:hypothetical protein
VRTPDALRYLDQVVDAFDLTAGLALPQQIARRVTLDVLPDRDDDDELPRLARLDLRGTGVSPALVRELRARGPEVVAGTSTL